MNCIFIGCFLYPHGYAATKRKQQFLDYIVQQKDYARVLLTLKRAKGHELNDEKGVCQGVPYEVVGANLKPNILFPITFIGFLVSICRRLLLYKRASCKNLVVAFGINWDTVFPLIFAKIIGYSIVFDIVEDFSTLQSEKGIIRKIQHWIRVGLPALLKKYLADGVSVISQRIFEKHLHSNLKVPLIIVPISAQNLFLNINKFDNQSSFDFLYAGTFGDKEGLETLFTAFDEINSLFNDTRLILTGKCPDPYKNKLLSLVKNASSIVFTGRLDDENYYRTLYSANVMMMTRTNSAFANSGFPYKLGEYLATGNPVICSKVSDIAFYLQNEKNAILVEPDNVNTLVQAMKFCYENYEQARAIGLAGKNICEKYFNPAINSKRFYQLLQAC